MSHNTHADDSLLASIEQLRGSRTDHVIHIIVYRHRQPKEQYYYCH